MMVPYVRTPLPQVRWRCLLCDKIVGGAGDPCRCEKPEDHSKVLNEAQVQALRDLHRKVKGSYLQLTQLLDELDLLMRTV